jgi:uncharacterized membrane protein YkvA (DUF1232 family)
MMNRRSSQPLGSARIFLEPGLWDNTRLFWRLLRDERVAPVLKLIVPLATLLYLISPIDLVPDFLLGVGQVDDLGVLAAALLIALRLLPRLAPRAVLSEHLVDLGLMAPEMAPASVIHRRDGHVIDVDYRVSGTRSERNERSRSTESERGW